jgi:integrase/recombinase XerD
LDTGLRVEEFCHLEKNNIDWSGHKMTVYGKNTKGGPKKKRDVPMTDRVKPLIEGWIAQNDNIGMCEKTAWSIVKKVANRCAIGKCSPHVLRHTFAVLALERGVSLPALQKVLGHEDLTTTAIYLDKSNAEAVREFQEKF